jgi:hypothetical protein
MLELLWDLNKMSMKKKKKVMKKKKTTPGRGY